MEMIDTVLSAIKEMMLPELDKIREENREIKTTLIMMNKRLDDMNLHLIDHSRRIDETNKRMDSIRDELTRRMDAFSQRLDRLYDVIVRRDEHLVAEERITALERDMAEIKYRLAA